MKLYAFVVGAALIFSTIFLLIFRYSSEWDLWCFTFLALVFGGNAYNRAMEIIERFYSNTNEILDVEKNIKQEQFNEVERVILRMIEITFGESFNEKDSENITQEQFNEAKSYVEFVQNRKLTIFLSLVMLCIYILLVEHYSVKTWEDLQNLLKIWLL